MAKYPELVDVNPSLNLNTPELQVKVDRQRAADIGVRMTDISDAVRLFYSGEDEITRFKEGSEQYPVTMQLLQEQRDNPDVLARMMVPSTKLGQVRWKMSRPSCADSGRPLCGATTANFRSVSLPTWPRDIRWTWRAHTRCSPSRKSDCRQDTRTAFPGR